MDGEGQHHRHLDGVPYQVISDDVTFDGGIHSDGQAFSFTEAGTQPYSYTIRSSMLGEIIVVP